MKKVYELEHLDCAHCAAKMEERINRLPEVTSASISFPMKRLYVNTMREDILPSLQEICSRIEPDIKLYEADSASERRKNRRKNKKHQPEEIHHEHHHNHCDCDHEHDRHHDHSDCDHEHDHHHDHCDCGHDHEHEHHHDHCGCGHDHEHEHESAVREGTGTAVVFLVEHLGCAHCAAKMEEKINQLPGVEAANLTYATKQLRVWAEDAPSLLPQIQEICSSIEPQVEVSLRSSKPQKTAHSRQKEGMSDDTKSLMCIILGIGLFIAGKVLESSFLTASNAYFIIAYIILGARIVLTALKNISRGQVFDENFLMSVATIGAFGVGDFAEAVGVMLFYRIGELFESIAVERSRSQIMDVIDMRPEVVHYVESDGTVTDIDAQDADVGDILQVRPGDRIPLDGTIISGETMVDTSPVTGEPVPVAASP